MPAREKPVAIRMMIALELITITTRLSISRLDSRAWLCVEG
jgi:hypothetical protein